MNKIEIRKCLVLAIICMFVGASFVPSISGDFSNLNPKNNELKKTFQPGKGRSDGWGTTELVSETETNSWWPRIAVEAGGAVHVVWDDGGFIYYRNRTKGIWNTPEMISDNTFESVWPDIVIDSERNIHVAWSEYDSEGKANIYYAQKKFGDDEWGVEKVFDTSESSHRPSIGVEPDQTVHIAWSDKTNYEGSGNDWDIFHMKKDPDQNWLDADPPEVVSSESDGDSVEPSLTVHTDGTVHIFWEDHSCPFGGYSNIYWKFIPDGGHWSTQPHVDISQGTGTSKKPSTAIDNNGKVHVVWYDNSDLGGSGTDYDIFYSETCGLGYLENQVVSTESTNYSEQADIAIFSDGTMHVVWSESGSIVYKNSTWYGGWSSSPTVKVSTESGAISSWWPSIDVNISGVHVAWADRTDILGAGTDYDIFYKRKTSAVNIPPTPDPNGPYTAEVDEIITFDASGSYDEDGTIDGYRWDWDNDGNWDTDWLTQDKTTHSYSIRGRYTVKLQVKDNNNSKVNKTTSASIGIYPDLIIQEIKTPTKIVEDTSGKYSVIIKNNGDETVEESFYVEFLIDDIAVGDPIFVNTRLSVGGKIPFEFYWTPPVGYQGIHTFKVFADSYETIHETNEDNNTKTVELFILPANYLTPEANVDLIIELQKYYEKIKDFILDNWDKAIELANPLLTDSERKEIQDDLSEQFPSIETIKEEVNVFYSYIENLIQDGITVTFTSDDEGILITIEGGTTYLLRGVYLPSIIDEIILEGSIDQCHLTFKKEGETLFTLTLKLIFRTYFIGGWEIGLEVIIDDINIGDDISLTLTASLSLCPSIIGPITLGFYGEIVIGVPGYDITILFNDPISLKNAQGSLGLFVGGDVSGYAGVGGGVGLEAGAYISQDLADFNPIGYAQDLKDCLETHGGKEYGSKLVTMLMRGIEVGACFISVLPKSLEAGIEFGVEGQVGLGVGGSAAGAGAEASINAMAAVSAGMSCPVYIFGDQVLENNETIAKLFIKIEEIGSSLGEIFEILTEEEDEGDWWNPYDVFIKPLVDLIEDIIAAGGAIADMIIAFYDAMKIAEELYDNIEESARENISYSVSFGQGIGGEVAAGPEFAGGIMFSIGAETNLETMIAGFTLDLDKFLNEGYGAVFLDTSVGIGINFGPLGITGGVSKEIIEFSIQGTGDSKGKGRMTPMGRNENTTVRAITDYGVDIDGDGLYDTLTVDIEVNVTHADNYSIGGMLFYNDTCVVYARNASYLTPGNHSLSLHFDGLQLRNKQENGSYRFGAIAGGDDYKNSSSFVNFSLYDTSSYDYTDFQKSSLSIVEITDFGVDLNENDYYDLLQVDVEVNSTVEGSLIVTGVLFNDNVVLSDKTQEYVSPGASQFSLFFDGEELRKSGLDSPYNLSIKIYNQKGILANSSSSLITGYSYSDFELVDISFSNVYFDRAVDSDGDGLYDYLAIDVGVNVSKPGTYTLAANLDGNNSNVSFYLSNTTLIGHDGYITLYVDGSELRKTMKVQNFLLRNVVLYDDEILYGTRKNPHNTSTYNFDEFGYPNAFFTRDFDEQVVDLNNNQKYDYLQINIGVNATKAGMYKISGYLNCSQEFVYSQNYTYLTKGEHTVALIFDGEIIREKEYSGIYRLQRLGLLQEGEYIDYIDQAYNTSSYTYTNFEKYNIPPIANFSYTPQNPVVGQTISFDASVLSSDPDGSITSYEWYYGDGASDTGSMVTHAYSNEGRYTVTLIVTDNDNDFDIISKVITIPGPTVVGHWHFNEGTGTIAHDSSNYNNDGTIYGGATWVDGISKKALNFDGQNDYVEVSHSSSLDITNHFSVEAWIKANSSAGSYRAIVDKYEYQVSNEKGFTLYINNDGLLRFSIYGGSGQNKNVFSTTNIRDNIWHHVAGMWNGTNISIYVDGEKEGDNACTFGPASTTQKLAIGRRTYLNQMRFNGTIDDVRITHDATLYTLRSPAIVRVDDDYDESTLGWNYWRFNTLQSGINAVDEHGSVHVENGTYKEKCTILRKSLDIIGFGPQGSSSYSTILDGDGSGTMISIENSDYVNITGCQITNGDNGIQLENSNYCTIFDNSFTYIDNKAVEYLYSDHNNFSSNILKWNNANYGIRLYKSSYNTFIDNHVFASQSYGIRLTHGSKYNYLYDNIANGSISGISLTEGCSNNTLIENEVYNSKNGILVLSDGNVLSYNEVYGNVYGISLINSYENDLIGNIAYDNNYSGIFLGHSSMYNYLYNNQIWKVTGPPSHDQRYGVYLLESPHNELWNNDARGNDYGYYLKNSGENILSLNSAFLSNSEFGCYLESSCNNILTSNGFSGGGSIVTQGGGLALNSGSSKNVITGNTLSSNYQTRGDYGIYIGANSNENNISGDNWIYFNDYGIYITSSSENEIFNNIIDGQFSDPQYYRYPWGIHLESCEDNVIFNNNIIANNRGIVISGTSSDNEIYQNDFNNNDGYSIYVDSTNYNNPIIDNDFKSGNENGILLDSSASMTIRYNEFDKCGISLQGDHINHWTTHTIIDNSINSKPIRYYKNVDSIVIPANTAQVILANSDQIAIDSFTVTNDVDVPIQLGFSEYNMISNTTLYNNNLGIYLEHSSYNDIAPYNDIGNNDYGICFKKSSFNNITESNIAFNNKDGIILEDNSNENNISESIIINNSAYGVIINHSFGNDFYNNVDISLNYHYGLYIINSEGNTIFGTDDIGLNLIGLFNSNHTEISENHVWNGCIKLVKSDWNTISSNLIDNCETGIHLQASSNNLIQGNTIENNYGHAIWLEDNNMYPGIGSDSNIILENLIQNNPGTGCRISMTYGTPSNNNHIYNNDFISNSPNGFDIFTNYWDDGYPTGGNYWSDYASSDSFHGPSQNIAGGDGIGDSPGGGLNPYIVAGGSSTDDYPFINPSGWSLKLWDAVDNSGLGWTTGGDANWFRQEKVYYYDSDAAQSGEIGDGEYTWIKTNVNGPGTLRFYWNVSSENNTDWLRFSIDSNEQNKISGNGTWHQKTYSIGSGSHELLWNYTKAPGGGGFAFHEDFEGGWLPTGWTQNVYQGDGVWEPKTIEGSDKDPYGAYGTYAIVDSEGHPDCYYDVGLLSPPMDLSEVTNPVYLECGMSFMGDPPSNIARIMIWSTGGTILEEVLAEWIDPIGPNPFIAELNLANYASQNDVQIEFWFHREPYTFEGFFSVDNIWVNETSGRSQTSSIKDCGWLDFVEWSVNSPPYVPFNPYPADGALEVNISSDLGWEGGDPNPGDEVFYDIYFGIDPDPPFVTTIGPYPWDQTELTWDPGTLSYSTTYHWKILARDSHEAVAVGPIWNFTTEEGPIQTIFYPTDDALITEINPNNNEGFSPYIKVRRGGTGWRVDSLIKFDLSSIPMGTTITDATVHLYYYTVTDGDPSGRPINFHQILEDWDEETVTWINRPNHNLTISTSTIMPSSPGQWMEWDVKNDVQDFINGQMDNYGWKLIDPTTSGALPLIYFCSKDHSNPDYHPYLEITLDTGFILNLADFPMYEAESDPGYNEMCGPAVAKMALDYIWWNNSLNPEGPPDLYNQSDLYQAGLENNTNQSSPYFDTRGLWYIIQYNKPMPYSEYGYNFMKYSNTNVTEMLKRICLWINYTVGTVGGHKEGYPLHVPSVVPAYGDYTNWMAIRGFHSDKYAHPMPDNLTVYGFWVNDPYPSSLGGLGENSYKVLTQWLDDYYYPLNTDDIYNNKYVAILEPPEINENAVLSIAEPQPRFSPEQRDQLKFIQSNKDLASGDLIQRTNQWIIQAAIDGVTEELIPYDDHFAAVFEKTVPGIPFYVKSLAGHDYYAVPFNMPIISNNFQRNLKKSVNLPETVVVILIDADDGHFKEASWVKTPVKYLPITKTDAQNMVLKVLEEMGIELEDINDIVIDLVHRKSTPYYPEWRIIIEEYGLEFFIIQDGTIH